MKKTSACVLTAVLMTAGCAPHYNSLESEASSQMDSLTASLAEGIQSAHQGAKVAVAGEGPLADTLRKQLSERDMLASDGNDLSLQCSLDRLSEDMGYITIRFSDGTVISRSYRRIREKHAGAG